MLASRALTFIIFSGVVFGIVAAATSWANNASLGLVFLAYVLGGNVGMSLSAALIYSESRRHPES